MTLLAAFRSTLSRGGPPPRRQLSATATEPRVRPSSPPRRRPRHRRGRPRRSPTTASRLTGDRRTLLVVEDDEPFARILRDLARARFPVPGRLQRGAGAGDGGAVPAQAPSSWTSASPTTPLSVLDRLKHDARTRHIPVHVVSAGDYSRVALALPPSATCSSRSSGRSWRWPSGSSNRGWPSGCGGSSWWRTTRCSESSLGKLLGSHDVETVGAGTAAQCLALLKGSHLRLHGARPLPDASGYSLLETLSREDAYSFPPVIVYTGRDLRGGVEQRLRRTPSRSSSRGRSRRSGCSTR